MTPSHRPPTRQWPTSRRMETFLTRQSHVGARTSKRSAPEATFFSGLAQIDGESRSIRVAVTPRDFVLFDNWSHLDPATELTPPTGQHHRCGDRGRAGNEVADQLLDPIRELETPEEERYAVVLKRHGANGELPPVSFIFQSGEPGPTSTNTRSRYIDEPWRTRWMSGG